MERIGRYEVLGEVARGGMGAVFRARAPDGREVALKLLLGGRTATAMQRRRFDTEVRALVKVRHPGVVALLDAGEHEGVPFMALEWVEGESLKARIAREGPLDPRDAVELVRRIAVALAHCHAQGVLHRDLTPGNVLLRASDGAALLTDFGLARDVSASLTPELATRTGQWMGTPGYWPPEQVKGDQAAVGPHSDVYGLGAVLFGALTGQPPQAGESLTEVLATVDRPPRAPGQLRPGVPPWLDAACLVALDPDPGRRPSSALALAELLDAGLFRGQGSGRLVLLGLGVGALAALALVLALPAGVPAPVGASSSAAATSSAVETIEDSELARAVMTCLDARDLEGAQQLIADAIARDDPDALLVRGVLRQTMGDLPGAAADFGREAERTSGQERVLALLRRAAVRLRMEDREGALLDYDRALEIEASSGQLWLQRAQLRSSVGNAAGALADADRAIRLAGNEGDRDEARALRDRLAATVAHQQAVAPRVRALVEEARQLANTKGDVAGAMAKVDEALLLDASDAGATLTRAALIAARKDHAGAVTEYSRGLLLATREQQILGLAGRGAARAEQGDLTGALADLDALLELDPRAPGFWRTRADLRFAIGDLRGALADYEHALALDATQDWATAAREACEHLRKLLADPARAADALVAQGLDLGRTGDLDGAIVRFSHAIELCPTVAGAWANRGMARQAKNDVAGALTDYDRAIELDSSEATFFYNRGSLHKQRGDWRRVVADLDRVLVLRPGDTRALAQRASAHMQLADAPAAARDYDQLFALQQPDAELRFNRGLARQTLQQLREAIDDYDLVLELRPDHAGALAHRGLCREQLGQGQAALDDLDRALALDPVASWAEQVRAARQRITAGR